MAEYQQDRYGTQPNYGQSSDQYGPPPPDLDYGPAPPDAGYGQRAPSQYDYDPSNAGQQDVQGAPVDDDAYKQYTEGRMAPLLNAIDRDNGIAPRRCTDCICLFVFLAYVLGMVILVSVCKNGMYGARQWSDIRRLSHGHDAAGNLCGVDPEVVDKPFLFWCRTNWRDTAPNPSWVNLEYPACVPSCPGYDEPINVSTARVGCLFNATSNPMTIPAQEDKAGPVNPFGTVQTYHIQFQQSVAETVPYDTLPFGGRFCVPKDLTWRANIISGPMRLQRILVSASSLQDPWTVLFVATLAAIVLGYVYLFLVFTCPRIFTMLILYSTYFLLTAGGLFFFYGLTSIVADHTDNENLLKVMKWEVYKEFNPFFESHTAPTATFISVIVGAALLVTGCGVLGTITHVAGNGFGYIADLLEAAQECLQRMPTMLVPPAVEGILKFLFTWLLGSNFLYLCSVGWYEDRMLRVNGVGYKDLYARYHFDTSILPWMVYYIFGWVWIIELITSFSQFLVSFSVITWYFMKKEGHVKTGVPPTPPLHAALHGLVYNAGSLCLGAAIIPWVRLIRVFNWVEDESVPDKDARCCPEGNEDTAVTKCINSVCACVGGLCSRVTALRKKCSPACCLPTPDPEKGTRTDGLLNAGCAYRYTKNGYNDVIIRSQHYLQASLRAFRLIYKNKATRDYVLNNRGCQVVCAVGVVSIGTIGSVITHLLIMSSSSLTDPRSSSFIADPFLIDGLAFVLCANVGYGFMALFDHTADTLLYCYAWNKKFAQDSNGPDVEEYLPESLRDVVDLDMEDEEDTMQLYGCAESNMYLRTFTGSKRQAANAGKLEDRARKGPQTSTFGGSPAASARSGSSRQFGAFGTATGSRAQYQALSTAGGP